MTQGAERVWGGVKPDLTSQVILGTADDCAKDGEGPWDGVPEGGEGGVKAKKPLIPHGI